MKASPWPIVGLCLVVSCGDRQEGPVEEPGSRLLARPPEGAGLQYVMRASAEPGREVTYCQRVDPGAVDIGRLEHAFDGRSHHFFVYESLAKPGAFDGAPFDCENAHDLQKTALVYAAQREKDELVFPEGVALEITAGRSLLFEWHVVNASDRRIEAEAAFNLWFSEQPPRHYVGMLSYYNPFIHVPAHGEATATMNCRVPEDVTLFWTSSHMHERGASARAEARHQDGARTALYETDDWEDAAQIPLDGVEIARNDTITFACDYRNTGAEAIVEGSTARGHEMCMFFAGYYPRMRTDGADACSGIESGPVFSGARTCAESYACLTAAADPVERERCWVDTSEASTPALLDLAYRCARTRCAEPCADEDFGSSCVGCLVANCQDELDACAETEA